MSEVTGSSISTKYKHEIATSIDNYLCNIIQSHLAIQRLSHALLCAISNGDFAKDNIYLADLVAYGKVQLRHDQETDRSEFTIFKRTIRNRYSGKQISKLDAISKGYTYAKRLFHNQNISQQIKTLTIGLDFAALLSVIGASTEHYAEKPSAFAIPALLLRPFGQLQTNEQVSITLNNSEADMNFLHFNNPITPHEPIILRPNIIALSKFLTQKKIKPLQPPYDYQGVLNTLIKMLHTDYALPDDPAFTEALKALTIISVERLKHRKG